MKMRILKTAFVASFLTMTSSMSYALPSESQNSTEHRNCPALASEAGSLQTERILAACEGECGQILGQCLRGCAQLPQADAENCRTACREEHTTCLTECSTPLAGEILPE